MKSNAAIVVVAVLAAAMGLVASLLVAPSAPPALLRSELAQRVLGWWIAAPAPRGITVAQRGERIAPLSLAVLGGGRVTLPGAYAGRPVLINLWASWCPPCIREMPALQKFDALQGGTGVQVVGIALDDPDAVRRFVQRTGVRYPILLDTPGPADAGVRLGNTKGVLPYSILLSADGRVLKRKIGPFADDEITAWARE